MTAEDSESYLLLSGVQHFVFCKRQWALITLEQVWQDNILTAEGAIMHEHAHDESFRERRGSIITVRGLSVYSKILRLHGKCDVVEFHASDSGHPLSGEDGLWCPIPVEYKRGRPKVHRADHAQLCAQAICLEEMLCHEVPFGYMYYGQTKLRERVDFTDNLRDLVQSAADEMHDMFRMKHIPSPKRTGSCKSCSIVDECMPYAQKRETVEEYIESYISEDSK
jgi:CRISPR-associated exonuclease Cas4